MGMIDKGLKIKNFKNSEYLTFKKILAIKLIKYFKFDDKKIVVLFIYYIKY
jgi:hypothetical protein